MSLKKKIIFTILILVLVCPLFLFLLFNALLQNPRIQKYLIDHIAVTQGYDIETGRILISFRGGVKICINNLEAKSKTDSEHIAVSKLEINLDALELLSGHAVPKRLYLYEPSVKLSLKKNQTHEKKERELADFINSFASRFDKVDFCSIEKGSLFISGRYVLVKNFFLNLSRNTDDPSILKTKMLGKIDYNKDTVLFSAQGSIFSNLTEKTDACIDMDLTIRGAPLTWLPELECLPVRQGIADAKINLKILNNGKVAITGDVAGKDLIFHLINKAKAKKKYSLPEFNFNIDANYIQKVFTISSLKLDTPDHPLEITTILDLRDKTSPCLDLEIKSPFMQLSAFKKSFPGPILSMWVETDLFPVFSDGKVRIDLLKIEGTLDQIKHMRLNENARVFSMHLSVKDMEILKDKGIIPFTNTSAKIKIDNGMLLVTETNGIFGQSVVDDAYFSISSLFTGKHLYTFFMRGTFELADLKQQSKISFCPENLKKQIDEISSMSGVMDASVNIIYNNKLELEKGEFKLEKCSITHRGIGLPLDMDEAYVKIDKKKECSFNGAGLLGKSNFSIKGSGKDSGESFLKNGTAQLELNADIKELLNRYYPKKSLSVNLNKLLKGSYMLSWDSGRLICEGKSDLQGLIVETGNYKTRAFEKGDTIIFNMELCPKKRLDFKKILWSVRKSKLYMSGSLDLEKKDKFNLNLFTEKILLEDSGIFLKSKEKAAKGTIKGNLEINSCLHDFFKTSVKGDIKAENLSFFLDKLSSGIKNSSVLLKFSGDKIQISSIALNTENSSLKINGNLKGWNGIKGNINIDSDFFDFSDIIGSENFAKDERNASKPNPFINNSDISININLKKGRWKKAEYSQLNAETAYRAGTFFIDRCKVLAEKGVLKIKGYFKTGADKETSLAGYIKLDKYPVQNILLSVFKKENLEIEGVDLSTEGFFSIKGRDKKELIENMNGGANLILEKGIIKKSGLIFSILDFLSLQKIIDRRPAELSREGFYFKNISGIMEIEHGVLNTDNLIMESPVFNAAGKGNIDFTQGKIDFGLGVAPMGTIDMIVSSIPIVGYILTGDEKSMVTFYFKVYGELSKPSIQYVPFTKWPESIFGYLKRVFFTPGRMVKNIIDIKQDLEKKGILIPEEF